MWEVLHNRECPHSRELSLHQTMGGDLLGLLLLGLGLLPLDVSLLEVWQEPGGSSPSLE